MTRASRASGALILLGPMTSAGMAQPSPLLPDSRRDCAVCHLEWVKAYERSEALVLTPQPDERYAAQEDACLGCHDGSVGDSRRSVWVEHGHKTGVTPPEGMKVPEILPLTDGTVTCRTCHTAHARGTNETLDSTVFLRVNNSAGQLCQMCHADHTVGRELGTHPTGGMPWPIPESLIAAGAQVGPDGRTLTCQVCHMAHGSSQEHLLVMGTGSNQLCLSCHADLRPGMFREDRPTDHPSNPKLTDPHQLEVIRKLGTAVGRDDRLVCLSCHKIHHGKGRRFLLADEPVGGQFCINCHPDKGKVTGSPHDLGVSAPDERNRLGMLPAASGSCGACHLFHDFARPVRPTPQDPVGQCTTCHHADQCASESLVGQWGHPVNVPVPAEMATHWLPLHKAGAGDDTDASLVTCITCHDPHATGMTHGNFLRTETTAASLCVACHTNMKDLTGGPHDALASAEKWPVPVDGKPVDLCLSCHLPHGDDPDHQAWTTRPAPGEPIADGACLGCHAGAGWSGHGVAAAIHPRIKVSVERAGMLPLLAPDPEKGIGMLGCKTCHDPHGSPKGSAFLRISSGGPPTALCSGCHDQTRYMHLTAHGPALLSDAHAGSVGVCTPCHVTHGDPTSLRSPLQTFLGAAERITALQDHCRFCHWAGGSASSVDVPAHPLIALTDASQQHPSELLLAADPKNPASGGGEITCVTCHLPHGAPHAFEALSPGELAALTASDARSLKPMLRPAGKGNLCSSCHGFDSLRRFLYYHRPDRRGGPIVPRPTENVRVRVK